MVCGDANWKGAGTREERKHEARPMCACILQAGCACYMGTQGRYTEEEGEENEIGKEGSVAPMYLCGGGISNDHRVVYLIALKVFGELCRQQTYKCASKILKNLY